MQEPARNGRKTSRLDEPSLTREVFPCFKGQRVRYPGVAAVAVVLHQDEPSTAPEVPAHESEHSCLVFDEMKRVRHNDPVELTELEAPGEVGDLDAQLRLRDRGDERGSQLCQRGAVAIDRVYDTVRADEVGKREGEGSRPRAEIGPCAALALRDATRQEGDVILVVHDDPSSLSRQPSVESASVTGPSASNLTSIVAPNRP